MTEEENILKMIIEKESWEEIIYHIVSIEQLDPWNVDLVKLTDRFLKFIKSAEDLDFRIPAKIVFIAAILLRLKADYLSIFEEKEEVKEMLKEVKPFAELGIDPNLIQLGYPMKRIPKRQVTLDELMTALKKALIVREKKVERRRIIQAQLQAELLVEEDITLRTEKLLKEIEDLLAKLKKDRLEFRHIVDEWNREQIVEHFVPVLHLEQNQKIKCEQEEFFKEIFISKVSS
jgi:segregation and condensation protein A